MSRKVINIKRAKRDRNKPFMQMSRKELKETFHDLGGSIYEAMLDESLSEDHKVRLISVVLSDKGGRERLVCTYEEYGDGDHADLCEEIIEELTPFLHEGESLRTATFEVDLDRIEQFEFPSKKMWKARESGDEAATSAWRSYGQLHDARGVPTIVIVWLIGPGKEKRPVTYDIDHGDGCGMYEHALDTIEGMRWNKLIPRSQHLKAAAYRVPMEAIREVEAI